MIQKTRGSIHLIFYNIMLSLKMCLFSLKILRHVLPSLFLSPSFHPCIHTNALIVVLLKLRIENNGYVSPSGGDIW